MTEEETILTIQLIKDAYQNKFHVTESLIDSWTEILSDADYDLSREKLIRFIRDDVKGFPPMPGQFRVKEPLNGFIEEREKIKRWEEEAKANPPTQEQWNQLKELRWRLNAGCSRKSGNI